MWGPHQDNAPELRSSHGFSLGYAFFFHFPSCLHQRTQSTEQEAHQVIAAGTLYSMLLPDELTDFEEGEDVDDGNEGEATALAAVLSNLLSCLSEHNAWAKVRHDAELAVAEAAKGSKLPFCHLD